jgi:phage tail sheath protein FI
MALEYYTPGVYVEEMTSRSASMTAAPTNITGFIGETRKGTLNKAIHITSWEDYFSHFIGYTLSNKMTPRGTVAKDVDGNNLQEDIPNDKVTDLDWGVYVYFSNGGGSCYVVSVKYIENNSEKVSTLKANLKKEEHALIAAKDKKVVEARIADLRKELTSLSSESKIDKGIIGNDDSEQIKNYWKLDHVLRDIILNLIDYKGIRERKFDYETISPN